MHEETSSAGGHSSVTAADVIGLDDLPADDLGARVVTAAAFEPSVMFTTDPPYIMFFDSLCRLLHRSHPRHILFVRERGTAEQAALVELTRRAVIEGIPPFLSGRQFVRVDVRHLAADECRAALQNLFRQVRSAEQLILFIDGIAQLLRSRFTSDTPALMRSLLVAARCRVVGIVSPAEFEELVATDPDVQELFSAIRLPEPQGASAVSLVRHFASGLQVQYKLEIDDRAVERAVSLSSAYIPHERLPAKAVKVLRNICDDMDYDRTQLGATRDYVTEADVVAKVAELTGIPHATLAGVGDAVDYRRALGEQVLGQDHAIEEVATELGLIKAGLTDAGKPASVVMFIGQTGTGKTELAKVLARFYSSSKRLRTFTLGNFSEPHSVSGIIGVPPGYVGHDQGGRLVNELNADPYGVFLLDEADKAHPDVMQPFLNLFDEGWICDQRGVKAYAERAIFILTTNVGQRQIADMCKQGKPMEEITATMKESLSRIRHTKSNRPVFTPEFLARIKRFIVFRSLDEAAMQGIARKLVAEMREQWRVKRAKDLEIPDDLTEAVGRRAFALDQKSDGKEGGRIVRKLLADLVESKIQAAIGAAPQVYQGCRRVRVVFSEGQDLAANASGGKPCVTVTFESNGSGVECPA